MLVVVTPPNTISNPIEESSTIILSHPIDPTLVMLPSVTDREVAVNAPQPRVPVVERFSSPKLIEPLLSVILPFAKVRLPIVDPVSALNVPVTVKLSFIVTSDVVCPI